MTKLECCVESCVYNQDSCCKKDSIQVMGDTAHFASETSCGSFSQRKEMNASSSAGCPCVNTEVKCEAVKCKYNNDQVCSANHIDITGRHADSLKETECATFCC